ncbi:MAG: NAD(P)H-dependent oxidoreductase [Caldilinea sp.]
MNTRKVLILDGALEGDRATPAIAVHAHQTLIDAGWTVETIALRAQKIAYCLGCFECWVKTPGLCRIDDDGRTVTAAMLASDLVIYLTPLTYGGYSSQLKKALDRSICLISPFFMRIDGEVHHKPRYDRYPAILGLGVCAVQNAAHAELFARLVARNAINLHAPAQGAVVVNRNDDGAAIAAALHAGLAHLGMGINTEALA